jgi:hypothetical protein
MYVYKKIQNISVNIALYGTWSMFKKSLENWSHPLGVKVETTIPASNLFPYPTETLIVSILNIKTSSTHHVHVRVGTYVQRLLLVEKQRSLLGGST